MQYNFKACGAVHYNIYEINASIVCKFASPTLKTPLLCALDFYKTQALYVKMLLNNIQHSMN